MKMLYVPAGEFTMGADDAGAYEIEKPIRQVYLDAYWIDKNVITNTQYALCVADGHCSVPINAVRYHMSAYAEHPIVNVSWEHAYAYCEWAGGSLPTEAQWEKVARGTDARKYPWGNGRPDGTILNFDNNTKETSIGGAYPNGSSPYDVMDMAGNVWEWVMGWYGPYQDEDIVNPIGLQGGEYHILRGGSWASSASLVRSSF